MNSDIVLEKLNKILYECDKHLMRIHSSADDLRNIMPLTKEEYINLIKVNSND
jgi:hypothetical protein